jgi:hypothetical protein
MTTENKTEALAITDEKRRAVLKRIGRYAAVTPPAVALLLAGASKPAKAQPSSTPR